MNGQAVTIEMVYNLLKDFKEEIRQRFEQVDKRFEQLDERMGRLENRQMEDKKELVSMIKGLESRQMEDKKELVSMIKGLESRQMEDKKEFVSMIGEDRKMLMDIWRARDKVTVNFSRSFVAANALISAIVSGMTSIFVTSFTRR